MHEGSLEIKEPALLDLPTSGARETEADVILEFHNEGASVHASSAD